MEHLRRAHVIAQFKKIWFRLFTTPVHLDSALSDVPAKYRPMIYTIVTALLLRPHSLARYLRLKINETEPWRYNHEILAEWKTIHVAADRLFDALRRDPHMLESTLVKPQDFPIHMLEEFERIAGQKNVMSIAKNLVATPPVVLRVRREIAPQEILKLLQERRILPPKARLSTVSPQGIYIPQYARVRHTEEFEKGFYEIQDDGSQFLSFFALWPEMYGKFLSRTPGDQKFRAPPLPPPPKKNFIVVDACAGAGGKALAMADALGGKGRVYAYDISARKLQALRQRARRADLQNIQTLVLEPDAKNIAQFRETADLVLVDAPCSGWGVLRRNPDIKWRQTSEELRRLPKLQRQLLETYLTLVKPEGRLVFGVCTFRKAETLDIVRDFLRDHPEYKLGEMGFLGPRQCDGFFMANFIKAPKGKLWPKETSVKRRKEEEE